MSGWGFMDVFQSLKEGEEIAGGFRGGSGQTMISIRSECSVSSSKKAG